MPKEGSERKKVIEEGSERRIVLKEENERRNVLKEENEGRKVPRKYLSLPLLSLLRNDSGSHDSICCACLFQLERCEHNFYYHGTQVWATI